MNWVSFFMGVGATITIQCMLLAILIVGADSDRECERESLGYTCKGDMCECHKKADVVFCEL